MDLRVKRNKPEKYRSIFIKDYQMGKKQRQKQNVRTHQMKKQ